MIKFPIAVSSLLLCVSVSFAQDMPGKGTTVDPIKGSPANAWFQHMVVQLGLEALGYDCLLYTSPSPRDATLSRMPSSA